MEDTNETNDIYRSVKRLQNIYLLIGVWLIAWPSGLKIIYRVTIRQTIKYNKIRTTTFYCIRNRSPNRFFKGPKKTYSTSQMAKLMKI